MGHALGKLGILARYRYDRFDYDVLHVHYTIVRLPDVPQLDNIEAMV